MDLYFRGHDYRYAVEQTMLTLFPGQLPRYPQGEPEGASPSALVTLEEERAALKNGVLALQGYVNAPVCLRTRRPEAADEALKAFCGKGMLWAPGGQTVADACGALWRGWTEA